MSVEKGAGVTYIWYDIREDQLENIEGWTEVAKKIREITNDVKELAIAIAPVGGPRVDQTQKIRTSHYVAAGIKRSGKSYAQVVGNRAPHALWVHEGTSELTGAFIVAGKWMGPVDSTGGYRAVNIPPGKKWSKSGSGGRTPRRRNVAYFRYFTFGGQRANPWLEAAGQLAYARPGNH